MEQPSADIAIGLHQENAFDPNAGLYLVRATDASRWLWRTMAAYLVKYPDTWDQDLLGCLLRRHSPHGYLNSRAGCQTIVTNDSSITGGVKIFQFHTRQNLNNRLTSCLCRTVTCSPKNCAWFQLQFQMPTTVMRALPHNTKA